jgi:hypothetical protein
VERQQSIQGTATVTIGYDNANRHRATKALFDGLDAEAREEGEEDDGRIRYARRHRPRCALKPACCLIPGWPPGGWKAGFAQIASYIRSALPEAETPAATRSRSSGGSFR